MDFERSNVHVETYKHKGVDETSICENMERDNVKFQHKLEVGKIVHKVLLREGFPEHSLRPEYQQSLNIYRDHKLPIAPDMQCYVRSRIFLILTSRTSILGPVFSSKNVF